MAGCAPLHGRRGEERRAHRTGRALAPTDTATASLARYRGAAGGALQRRCLCWWTHRADVAGALLSSAVWGRSRNAGSAFLRRQPAFRALIPGGAVAGAALRAAQHDGLHSPAE